MTNLDYYDSLNLQTIEVVYKILKGVHTMEEKLFDSEKKVMEVIWKKGTISAKDISLILNQEIGWNKNTTYTVIKKCIKKEFIERIEPGFLCQAKITKQQVIENDTQEFINRVFEGSVPLMFSSLIKKEKLSEDEIKHLKQLIDKLR